MVCISHLLLCVDESSAGNGNAHALGQCCARLHYARARARNRTNSRSRNRSSRTCSLHVHVRRREKPRGGIWLSGWLCGFPRQQLAFAIRRCSRSERCFWLPQGGVCSEYRWHCTWFTTLRENMCVSRRLLANTWSWWHLHLRSLSACQDCPYLYRIPLLGALPAGIIHYYHRYDWATDVTREVCVMVAAPCAIRGLTCCECMDRNVTARTCLANVHARDRGGDCRCTPHGRGIRVEGEIHILREGVCAVCTVPCARPVDDIGLGTMAPTRASFSTVCSTSCLVMGSSTLTATCGASNGTYYGMRRTLVRHPHRRFYVPAERLQATCSL